MTTTHVRAKGAMQALVNGSGKSRRAVSLSLGLGENVLTSYASRGVIPGLPLIARIASVCGYTMQFVKDNDTIVIDPEEDND